MLLPPLPGTGLPFPELTDHPGHEKNAPEYGSNTRNGYSSKTLLCDDGEIELNTPRDRENTFEPQLIKKNQTRITQMDSQIYPSTPKA